MSKTIILKKATRIEGNADIHIEVENGRAKTTRFMVQDFRGFEKFMQGKPVAEQEIGKQLLLETVAYAESAVCRPKLLLNYFGITKF